MWRSTAALGLLAILCLPAAAQDKAQEPKVPADVTFSEHIAPIMFSKCVHCHRPGEIGPFPLFDYKDVRKRGKLIQQVTEKRSMPPWHAAPGHGEFLHEQRLTDTQIATIKKWVETDMAEGDTAKLPKRPEFTDGWQLGKPDLEVTMDKAFEVPATGRDIYRNFVLPLNLTEDKYVTAIELRPSARNVVHHILVFQDKNGKARGREGKSDQPGFNSVEFAFLLGEPLMGWAGGTQAQHRPMGLALPIAKGADLVLQTHFHPSGKIEKEQTKVGLYFAKKKPERTLASFEAPPFYGIGANINIPPGKKDYKVGGKFKLPVDVELISVSGHAHLICESMKATATMSDQTTKSLLYIPKWEFNWQRDYIYKEPVKLPKGTVVEVELIYNNSSENPANPFNPPKRIRWGESTNAEMGRILFVCVPGKESDLAELRRAAGTGLDRIPLGFLDGFKKKTP